MAIVVFVYIIVFAVAVVNVPGNEINKNKLN